MTPKGRERLGRLERRLGYVEKQIADDAAEGRTDRAFHYRKAEASALTWAVAELRRLDSLVEQIADAVEAYGHGQESLGLARPELEPNERNGFEAFMFAIARRIRIRWGGEQPDEPTANDPGEIDL